MKKAKPVTKKNKKVPRKKGQGLDFTK